MEIVGNETQKKERGMEIYLDKLYRDDKTAEPLFLAVPFPKGKLRDERKVRILDGNASLPLQSRVTSRYEDGSVRFLFLRFLADMPGNKKLTFLLDIDETETEIRTETEIGTETGTSSRNRAVSDFHPVFVRKAGSFIEVKTMLEKSGEEFSFAVNNGSSEIFKRITVPGRNYSEKQFIGPILQDGDGNEYDVSLKEWKVVEEGPVCVILKAKGTQKNAEKQIAFEVKLTAYAGKPWVEVSYRIINTTDNPFAVRSLNFQIIGNTENPETTVGNGVNQPAEKLDSTGCGEVITAAEFGEGPVYHARSSGEADRVMELAKPENIRTLAASSNYKTDYFIATGGNTVTKSVDADKLMKEANEHFAEVFYGTFFADYTDSSGGVAATVFQAQQNFPKAVEANCRGVKVFLVPEGEECVVLQSGMSREQKFLLHFHDATMPISEINNRSIIYQMPDRPYVSPRVHKEAGVWPEIFADAKDPKVEQNLIGRADAHARAYGMLNFGDSYDANYTAQGRGDGKLVWCNNEYDYPHSCALIYARTGIRRFMDYMIASCSHWMDVDICHYHSNPLYIGGQWEHTAGHTVNGVMVCSHEWVEGLLDYYHFTGDERGLETALGVGENVLKLLELPLYQKAGEANARETGWALRTLTALYVETNDRKWLVKCDKILNDFKVWEDTYGHWLAPYTDNTAIRVGFMISIAVGSLMRYYRVFPGEELKEMILRAVDDMIENCYVEDWGIFYYKELPSLNRLGNNTLLLEALTTAYDLTGDSKYLKYGMGTFRKAIDEFPSYESKKQKIENAVIVGSASSKNFAQSFIPLAGFYRAYSESVQKR